MLEIKGHKTPKLHPVPLLQISSVAWADVVANTRSILNVMLLEEVSYLAQSKVSLRSLRMWIQTTLQSASDFWLRELVVLPSVTQLLFARFLIYTSQTLQQNSQTCPSSFWFTPQAEIYYLHSFMVRNIQLMMYNTEVLVVQSLKL